MGQLGKRLWSWSSWLSSSCLRYSGLGRQDSVTLGEEVVLVDRPSTLRATLVDLDQGSKQAKVRNSARGWKRQNTEDARC